MISFLRGTLYYKKPPLLIIDMQGIGYECQASMSTFYHLPEIGYEILLYTHLVIREDAHALYAFFKEQEKTIFKALIKISNVGPKLALAILSGIPFDQFVKCIVEQDISALTPIPGIGKKTAERLLIELRDRAKNWDFQTLEVGNFITKEKEDSRVKDAISALVALGFKTAEASRLIGAITLNDETTEELIRLALKHTRQV